MAKRISNRESLLGRREVLAGLSMGAASIVLGCAPGHADEGERVLSSDANRPEGLITREREPLNLEYPFANLREFKTPNRQFFVRSHFPIPKIDRHQWRLRCGGHVHRELAIDYKQLRELPSKTVTATIECAGNSRVFLVPKAKGVLWELGGVSTAEWTGVPLAAVLDKAGIKDDALEVVLQGADKGQIAEDPKTPGEIHFTRSLPLDKARQAEVILAYQMNGEDLSVEHGFPLRAIVTGWYGMASVKWLNNIEVTDQIFRGYWQTAAYAYWKRNSGEPVSVPIGEMQVKSEIARPMRSEVVEPGRQYRVFGAAWSGEAEISKIELSTDGGTHWDIASLLGEAVPFAWRLWEFSWQVPGIQGRHTLMSRATDSKGRTQPTSHDADKMGYMINHTLPVEVEVR